MPLYASRDTSRKQTLCHDRQPHASASQPAWQNEQKQQIKAKGSENEIKADNLPCDNAVVNIAEEEIY